jgi:hypothetical protein
MGSLIQKTTSSAALWVVVGGVPGVREHGMWVQQMGERGRS